jgi:hypothetical protein
MYAGVRPVDFMHSQIREQLARKQGAAAAKIVDSLQLARRQVVSTFDWHQEGIGLKFGSEPADGRQSVQLRVQALERVVGIDKSSQGVSRKRAIVIEREDEGGI